MSEPMLDEFTLSYGDFAVAQNETGRWQAWDIRTQSFVGKSFRREQRCADYLHQLMREHRPEIMRFVLAGRTKP